ncbi:uncharacterized protein LOC131014344 [Salvia miltiorrhiza]|uniref:uncharacterized protein LOC131014344 n=1 Tax=Salvia miltiorrhiza TaxID=226208 RepID=UPI0025AC3C42|nr:uncharacterized protein LOC131014344 [Salvia miltiorrhiza]
MSDKDRTDGGGSDEEDREGREGKCKGCGRKKGKRLPFFRLRKSKKLLHQKRTQSGICVSSRGWGRRANGGGGGWCCLCLRQPKTLDSSGKITEISIESPFSWKLFYRASSLIWFRSSISAS